MKTKYTLFRRGGIYYSQDSATGQQKSLRTRDEAEALQLINARNEAQRQPVLTDANGNITSYSYCSCGALASITDPLGNSTVFTRDYDGNATQAASSDGFSTCYHRNILGQVTNLTTTAGLNLNYSYSGWGLVTRVTSPAGTVFAAAYDVDDRPVAITNAQGVAIANSYDSLGRLTGRDNAFGRTERNTYGPQGITEHDGAQWWQSTTYTYDPAGRLAGMTDANGNIDGFTYDAAGQIATLADGNGNVTSWAYDIYGRNIAKINGNNVLVETNGYDADGRLTAHWTPAKGLTHYTYDANGNPLTVAYSSGTGITAAYDALNRITSMSDAAGSSTFTWQNFGAFQGALAAEDGPWANDTVTHGYANRLPTSLTLAQPGGLWPEIYGYDSSLRLATIYSPAGTFGYTYNGAGRQIQSLSLPGSGNSIAGTYDAAGQLLATALTHGTTVLDSQAYVYDANGNRTSVTRTDGSHVNYGYDYASQLTSATGYEPNGTTLRKNENFSYQYDPAGNLAARQNNTLWQTFTTDGANELVNVARDNDALLTVAGVLNGHPSGLTVNGQAAAVYNDLTFAAAGVAINDGLNTFTAVVTTASSPMTNSMTMMLPASANLTYDLNGNLTSDGQKGYGYDCANELASETVTNGWRNEFVYDGLGRRRVRKEYSWSGGAWTETNEVRYVYDGMNVIQERDGNNSPLVSYTRGLDFSGTMDGAGGIGGLLARTDANGSAFYHADGNGNITAMMDADGNEVAKYLYDPYGNLIAMWGTLAQINTIRYSSKEIDLKSGNYYYGNRFYDPNLQRWLNNDPIQEWGGINLYQFVANNPINGVDLLGLAGSDDIEPDRNLDEDEPSTPEERFLDWLRWEQDARERGLDPNQTYIGAPEPRPEDLKPMSDEEFDREVKKAVGDFNEMRCPVKGAPKRSPNAKPPINPPQWPPSQVPPGYQIRTSPFTQAYAKEYPYGKWQLEKQLADGSWQPINPITKRPGPAWYTHIPFPPPN